MDDLLGLPRIQQMDSIRYTAYLSLLTSAFKRLSAYYGEVEQNAQTLESESMSLYVQKILSTVYGLRLKHSFSPQYFARPGVDLTDSGFPHFHDIMTLDADLATRAERLPKLLDVESSKRVLLDLLMKADTPSPVRQSDEVRKMQWQIAERSYLEGLNLRTQFFRFTPGKLFKASSESYSSEANRRGYHFSWGCYDSERNRPCVYFMLMTQDDRDVQLDHPDNPEYVRFVQTVDAVASRAPEKLMPIAVRLDEAFRGIHPKALKRICLGPLISPLLWDGGEKSIRSPLAQILLPVFSQAGLAPTDFVLFFSTEMIVSEREVIPNSIKSVLGIDKARQIFCVPKNDRQLLRRQASASTTYCILPHRLRQHLDGLTLVEIAKTMGAEDVKLLTYQANQEGVTHVG